MQSETPQQKLGWRVFSGSSAYPTPKSITHSPPLIINHQRRYFDTTIIYSSIRPAPPPPHRTSRANYGRYQNVPHPADRKQPEQQQYHRHKYVSPRSFEIISPSGKRQMMVLVERVAHITAQVEYGLVPADPTLRRYDEEGKLIGNEMMELLSPTVFEDTARGTFFFAERRPVTTPPAGTSKEASDEGEKETGGTEQKAKGSKGKDTSEEGFKANTAPPIPTLLDQLVKLKVLSIIPNVRCKSIEHKGACLVRVLLNDSEIAHSCSSPRHTYVLYEAAFYARFKVCTSCRAIPYRRGVYYCSEACLATDWPQHRIECGKTREQLQYIISMLPTILQPRPSVPARINVQTHRPLWYRAWLWMGYAAETDKNNTLDLREWKMRVKIRAAAGCRDLLPGF
ncbi:hypothetical protein M408DRAFT_308755 [Serendipita vermifera MAFF 305830]|uniref:MYND-type domain-containing protein n=1 Tax=Serendipita vermifera MAFF 305830 TaxID=933852 RepID=A0A0C3B9U8_SERVB|nr:hypothetical protein M408DRAFT_308755 [Serendipita vermifera MAFF 305830]